MISSFVTRISSTKYLNIWSCHGVDLSLVRLIYAIADALGDSPLRTARIPHSFLLPYLSSCTPSQVTYIDNVSSLVPCQVETIELDLRFQKNEDSVIYLNTAYNNDKKDKKFTYDYVLIIGQAVCI